MNCFFLNVSFQNNQQFFWGMKIRMRLKLETIFFLCSSEQEILLKLHGAPCVKLIHICLAEQHNEVEDIYAPLQRLHQPYDIRWLHLKGLKPVFFFQFPFLVSAGYKIFIFCQVGCLVS